MNTEPPEGDELQRMLVSMKQAVLERATPRPKRYRRRSGVVVGVVVLVVMSRLEPWACGVPSPGRYSIDN